MEYEKIVEKYRSKKVITKEYKDITTSFDFNSFSLS